MQSPEKTEGKKIEEYKKFLATWNYIHDLNTSDIFMYGWARHNSGGDKVIEYENDDQRRAYAEKYPTAIDSAR